MPSGIYTRSPETRLKMSHRMMGHKLNAGRIWSEESRRKVSEKMTGRKLTPYAVECIRQRSTGRKMSDEQKKKLSLIFRGPGSPNWRGGRNPLIRIIRASSLYEKWRTDVFRRDWYTCQMPGCDKGRGGWIEANHIILFSVLLKKYSIKTIDDAYTCAALWDINNGITLCKKCHTSIRMREYLFEKLFKTIING